MTTSGAMQVSGNVEIAYKTLDELSQSRGLTLPVHLLADVGLPKTGTPLTRVCCVRAAR